MNEAVLLVRQCAQTRLRVNFRPGAMQLELRLLEAKNMHHTGGPGWRITMDTSGPLLVALYIRDVAGLDGAGSPALSPVTPSVCSADHSRLTAHVGGLDALRWQWEGWWRVLLASDPQRDPQREPPVTPPDFPELNAMPALQRVVQAHFGAALSWSQEQSQAYARLAAERETLGKHKILADLVANKEMELGRSARDFTLTIVEMPLAEPRAWFMEPNRLIMDQHLLEDQQTFVSYVQPVVDMLV